MLRFKNDELKQKIDLYRFTTFSFSYLKSIGFPNMTEEMVTWISHINKTKPEMDYLVLFVLHSLYICINMIQIWKLLCEKSCRVFESALRGQYFEYR